MSERDACNSQVAALTERLRAVEAERDEARSGVKKSAEAYGALMEHAEKPRAELERKDAALVDANKNIHMLYDLLVESDAPTKQYDYSTRKESAIIGAMKFLAALQPKEPPCQTA